MSVRVRAQPTSLCLCRGRDAGPRFCSVKRPHVDLWEPWLGRGGRAGARESPVVVLAVHLGTGFPWGSPSPRRPQLELHGPLLTVLPSPKAFPSPVLAPQGPAPWGVGGWKGRVEPQQVLAVIRERK